MKTFDELLKEQLSNDEELRQEYELKKAIIANQEGQNHATCSR